jgi:Tfp pilus assembly protein PilZ
MSEAAQLARTAREHLAAALKALQSNTNVPTELLDVAEPIAEAMSVLHRVERTDGANLEGREGALANVRAALEQIQKVPTHHPATEVVMEAVASSLSKVHALTRYVPPAAAPRATPQPIAGPPAVQQVPIAAAPQPVMTQAVATPVPSGPSRPAASAAQNVGGVGPKGTLIQLDNQPSPFASAGYAPAPQPNPNLGATLPIQAESYAPHTHPAHPQQPAPQPAYQPPPQQAYQPPQQQAYQPPPQQQAYAPPPPQQAYQPPPPQQQPYVAQAQPAAPAQPQRPAPTAQPSAPRDTSTTVPATPTAGRIDVELGIHSTSNFYKGLGGNDVIEAGGIFVATYKVPKIGATVNLRVLLPGDYEFNAIAVVQWTRAAGDVSDPGFGARFTQITPEGRQLVYRYARNREPMFYDDL